MIKEFFIGFSFALTLSSCGDQTEESIPTAEAPLALRVGSGYSGTALVTAEPSVKIRLQPSASAPLLQTDSGPAKLKTGEGVFVRQTKKDPVSGQSFADVGFGWVDTRYLQKSERCTRFFQGPFSHAFADRNTNTILSLIGLSEGTGNCYNYMVGYKSFASYEQHPNQCQSFANTCSTAAGRYQFLKKTWDMIPKQRSGSDFGPLAQDAGAIYLLENRGFDNYQQTLNLAQFRAAIELISWEWASLPPGRYGQAIKQLPDLWQKYREWTGPEL